MKASDFFVKCLETEKVEYIFGLPGEETSDFMISMLNSNIRFILTRHEQSVAFMADVYGRLTQRVGVCLATLGPGATNLTTGIANANMDTFSWYWLLQDKQTQIYYTKSLIRIWMP